MPEDGVMDLGDIRRTFAAAATAFLDLLEGTDPR